MIRLVRLMASLLLFAGTGGAGQDFLPLDHGLKYTGRNGRKVGELNLSDKPR